MAVDGWRAMGKRLRLPASTLAVYERAFANACREEAQTILRL